MVKNRAASLSQPMYRLILMDFSMPICDGPKATMTIRSFLTENMLQQPFIRFLSAYSEQSYRTVAHEAGSD